MEEYPRNKGAIPPISLTEGRYRMRYLTGPEDLDRVLRLRFEVFNLELGEGHKKSYERGLDVDDYDQYCHHMVVQEASSSEIIGTYRLQTYEMASVGAGFCSAVEFDMTRISPDVLRSSVELGRACIDKAHRNTHVLYLLWKGLAAYATHNRKRYLFGCCSLTSQDRDEGRLIMDLLERDGHLHPEIRTSPLPGFECYPAGYRVDEPRDARLPRLFRTYLRFGARVCGEPAIDREFRTIDYFVVFDIEEMDDYIRGMFF